MALQGILEQVPVGPGRALSLIISLHVKFPNVFQKHRWGFIQLCRGRGILLFPRYHTVFLSLSIPHYRKFGCSRDGPDRSTCLKIMRPLLSASLSPRIQLQVQRYCQVPSRRLFHCYRNPLLSRSASARSSGELRSMPPESGP